MRSSKIGVGLSFSPTTTREREDHLAVVDQAQLVAGDIHLDIARQQAAILDRPGQVDPDLGDLVGHRRVQGRERRPADDAVGCQPVALLEPPHGIDEPLVHLAALQIRRRQIGRLHQALPQRDRLRQLLAWRQGRGHVDLGADHRQRRRHRQRPGHRAYRAPATEIADDLQLAQGHGQGTGGHRRAQALQNRQGQLGRHLGPAIAPRQIGQGGPAERQLGCRLGRRARVGEAVAQCGRIGRSRLGLVLERQEGQHRRPPSVGRRIAGPQRSLVACSVERLQRRVLPQHRHGRRVAQVRGPGGRTKAACATEQRNQ